MSTPRQRSPARRRPTSPPLGGSRAPAPIGRRDAGRAAAVTTSTALAPSPILRELMTMRQEVERASQRVLDLDRALEELSDTLAGFERRYRERFGDHFRRLANLEFSHRRLDIILRQLDQVDPAARDPLAAVERTTRQRLTLWEERRRRLAGDEPSPRASSDPARERSPQGRAAPATGAARPVTDRSAPVAPADPRREARQVLHALARRYHPDLAASEQDRLQRVEVMTRINALFGAGDYERLRLLADGLLTPERIMAVSSEQERELLAQRARRTRESVAHLEAELAALSSCEAALLYTQLQQEEAHGGDPWGTMAGGLDEELALAEQRLHGALRRIEETVAALNAQRRRAMTAALSTRGERGLARGFDPLRSAQAMRSGLRTLQRPTLGPREQEQVAALSADARERPYRAVLALIAWLNAAAPLPLAGLQRYQALAERYQALLAGRPAPPLTEALSEPHPLITYGPRLSSGALAEMVVDLHLADARLGPAIVEHALRDEAVSAWLKALLRVVGEHGTCAACGAAGFFVHLMRCRGLDDLHARVCPACGQARDVYWVMAGKDAVEALNGLALEHGSVVELMLSLAGATIAFQYLPELLARESVRSLRGLLVRDVFRRYRFEVEERQVVLRQFERELSSTLPLDELPRDEPIEIALTDAEHTPVQLLELLRYRIQHRFAPDGEGG